MVLRMYSVLCMYIGMTEDFEQNVGYMIQVSKSIM